MEQPPCYEDGTPMPRCQYCGEFFTGYTGNQVCADCHEHIVEMEKTIAQQRADIAALVEYVRMIDAEILCRTTDATQGMRNAIRPVIARYRDQSHE
jgi:hypothetical protein